MKTVIICLILSYTLLVANSQPVRKAVLEKNKLGFHKGDTIQLKGYNYFDSNYPNTYVTFSKTGTLRNIAPVNLKIIDTIYNFWDKQWYTYRSGAIARKGHDYKIRKELDEACRNYANRLSLNNQLLTDSNTLNYLHELVFQIFPGTLYKSANYQIKIHVIKTDAEDIFSFDNGTIFITTGKLANVKSEEDLIKLFSNEIAHIICDHQLQNRRSEYNTNTAGCILLGAVAVAAVVVIAANAPENNSSHDTYNNNFEETSYASEIIIESCTNYLPPLMYSPPREGLPYSERQKALAGQIAQNFVTTESGKIELLSPEETTANLSKSITQTSWDYFFQAKYKEALALVNRLENANSAGSDDYLLKAKLYRKLYSTDEAGYEALKYLQKARDISTQTNIDIVKEEGLIYFQLKNMSKAKECFEEYRAALIQIGITDENDKVELKWAEDMIKKTL